MKTLPTKPLPATHAELQLDGVISAEHHAQITQGYQPQTAQDKWLIYLSDNKLYFHRAVSGTCIFILNIIPHEDHFLAPSVLVNRDPSQYRSVSDTYDVEIMTYLIDRYLLKRNPPFPQPPRLGKQHRTTHQRHVIGETAPSNNSFISLDMVKSKK